MTRGLALALALALPLAASAADGRLAQATNHFEYGDFEKARTLAEQLLGERVLTEDRELIEANRIAGLGWFYAKDAEKARGYFVSLLSIDPDFKLDPFFTPPAAVEFFEKVRADNQELLQPIREQKAKILAARKKEEELRREFEEKSRRAAEEAARRPAKIKEVEKHYLPIVFLPLGAGQFQNRDTSMGILLATVQVVSGVTSVVSYSVVESLRDPQSGGFPSDRFALAGTLDVVKWASAGVFYVAWGYGIVDAWANFEPEVVRELEVAPPSPADAARPSAAGDAPPKPAGARLEVPRLLPYAAASPDGGGSLGLTLRF